MDSNIQEKLQVLFVEYTKKLPQKIDFLNKKWQELSRHWEHEKMQEFYREVHSMCGSAGTYGYNDLSHSARALEIYLKSLLDQNSLSVPQSQKITELLQDISKEFLVLSNTEPAYVPAKTTKNFQQLKLIYILENDKKFVEEIKHHLDSLYYKTVTFDDHLAFNEAIKKTMPGALIVNADFLGKDEIDFLQKLHQLDFSPPLFCTATEGDLLTRLKATRAGSTAFFLKSNELFYLVKTLDQNCGLSETDPLRILIVDDSSSLAEYYSIILQEAGMETRFITNPLRMLDVLNDFRPDLLLLDVYMPECSGLELAAVLRQEGIYAGIPIIFLSTEDDRFKQLAALNLGGDDFLTKPILPQHLIAAVRSRAKRAGILSFYMTRDSLTGLLNHTNVLQRLDIELSRAVRLNSSLCFLMIDIDHFKSVNDTYGHATGDHVIRKLSELLLTRLRKTDWVGRYGGEEFAVILPNTTPGAALALCKQIRELFGQCIFKTEEGKEFNVTFSAGLAIYPHFRHIKHLIEAADQGLYQAKHQGRNQEVWNQAE